MKREKIGHLQLAEVFQDEMVLQREKPVKIWGVSDSEQIVNIFLDKVCIATEKVGKGYFSFFLPPQETQVNITLQIGDVLFRKVDFGEVWIAGGQSNMEFSLYSDKSQEKEFLPIKDEHFRMYTVERYSFSEEKSNCVSVNPDWNCWRKYQKDKSSDFSAVAVYFALELRKMGIPVGILNCNWGGTTAAAWLDKSYLRRGSLQIYLSEYEQALSTLSLEKYREQNLFIRKGRGTEEAKKLELQYPELRREALVMGPWHENRPGGLYDMMLQQIKGYTLRGILWYQGESDDKKAELYGELLDALICCWRRAGRKLSLF